MKRKILFVLSMGILLLVGNAYGQGDLIVNGKLGLGTATPDGKKQHIKAGTPSGTLNRSNDIFVAEQQDDGSAVIRSTLVIAEQNRNSTQANNPVMGLNAFALDFGSGGNNNSLGYIGGRYAARLMGTGNITNASAIMGQVYRNGTGGVLSRAANFYSEEIFATAGATITDAFGFYAKAHTNSGGTITNSAGMWLEKQTVGTNRYGIVLNGDGAGADLVFGDAGGSCRPSIYSVSGFVKAMNKNCVESPLSPHDPETGEWIFYSKNIKTGKVVRVEMEKLVRAVEKITGETFMVETISEEN